MGFSTLQYLISGNELTATYPYLCGQHTLLPGTADLVHESHERGTAAESRGRGRGLVNTHTHTYADRTPAEDVYEAIRLSNCPISRTFSRLV